MFCFAACGLAGCIRDDVPVAPTVPGDNAIRLGISGIELLKTRASLADEATESRVDRLDVLIFDTDGKKAHYERVAGSQQDKGQITLSERRNEFTPGAEYWVYLIANSTLSETDDFGKMETLTDLRAKVQQDELIHVTGDGRTSGAPETFLMEGVAYPKNETEPSAPGRVVLNDGNMSENTELLVTLRRAAAKIEVVIKKGDKITFADQTHAAEGNNAAGYYINNMPYTTRLVPPTNETYLPEVVTPGRYNGPYFSWGDNPGAEVYPEQVRIKTYVYSHDWSRQSAFESEPYIVVNLPLWNHPDQPDVEGGSTYDPTQDPDSDAKYEQSNYYQIPICNPAQKRLDRNHIYRITVTVNAVGASNPTQAVDLAASYTVIPWETMTIGVGDDSSRPNYLMVNTDKMAMYNIDEDNNTLEFASSSKVTVTVVDAWYYDKNDDERYLNKNSKLDTGRLSLNWQWNHNPLDDCWSLTERPGFLRLRTGRVVDNLFLAPNTLTQRMSGPKCSGVVAMDVSKMKEGDVAGFSAFNGLSGVLAVVMENGKKQWVMSHQSVSLSDREKRVTAVEVLEKERIDCEKEVVYLRMEGDFADKKDEATFYYSYDKKTWKRIGEPCKMVFDYTKFFMGSKFAIFNYATKDLGGYVDIDYFEYGN